MEKNDDLCFFETVELFLKKIMACIITGASVVKNFFRTLTRTDLLNLFELDCDDRIEKNFSLLSIKCHCQTPNIFYLPFSRKELHNLYYRKIYKCNRGVEGSCQLLTQ